MFVWMYERAAALAVTESRLSAIAESVGRPIDLHHQAIVWRPLAMSGQHIDRRQTMDVHRRRMGRRFVDEGSCRLEICCVGGRHRPDQPRLERTSVSTTPTYSR